MIEGFLGLRGNGKTLEAVRRAKVEHDRGDVHVYGNLSLSLERSTFIRPQDLTGIRPGSCECGCARMLLVVDEIHLWLPARRSMQLPMSWWIQFSQTRKTGWETFFWTAQHPARVDAIVRDNSEWMWQCRRYTWPWEFFIYDQYEPENYRRPGKRLVREIRRRSRSASDAYSTKEMILEADHVKDRNDSYASPTAAQIGKEIII